MTSPGEFFLLAFAIGLMQGGIQSLSRFFYARMIPGNRTAEFFVSTTPASHCAGILSLLILFGAGARILLTAQAGS